MKSQRTNSFRLHRVSRASSLKKQSQTFYVADETFKLSAINSVTRGVKHSELSFLTGDDLEKLRVEPIIANDNFYQSAHLNLNEVRRNYDEAKKQRVDADENIIRLKADIRKYKIVEGEYLDKINQARQAAENLEKSLEDKKKLLQQTITQKKVLLNMRSRLKSDKVVYDQRKFNMEKQFAFQNTQLSVLRRDGYFTGEQQSRTEKIYEKLLNELNAENVQREQHLQNLRDMIEERKKGDQYNLTRGQQIYEIAERALQDKDPTEKQWHQIYLTNVFVSKMLRNKIDKEMEKFSIVEMAFKNIKTATGVNDSKTLVYKFLNKQAEYGGLLGRITINEKKISELKQERDRFLEQQKQLEIEKETLQNIKFKNTDISNELKNFGIVSDSERRMEILISKIATWINKQSKKFNSIEKTSISFQDQKNKETVKTNFIQFCQLLSQLLQKCEQKELSEAPTPSQLSARDSARVSRVIPKKSRKNTKGEEIFDVDEEQLAPTNQIEEKDLISSQRDQVVRNNERFLKQARKRFQQKRKLNLENKVEKKQKKVAEVKKDDE